MLVHPQFDPVAIHLGPLAVHWYGLMYLAGFIAFLWLGRKRIVTLNNPQFTAKLLDDLLFYGVLGVILGGRLGYVLFYKPGYYAAHPLEIFAVWQGGMSFHGGFLGVLLFTLLWIYARKPRPVGAISGLFLIGYGSFRFIVEFTREPDDFLGLLSLGMSMGQWLSLPMVIAGVLPVSYTHLTLPTNREV